jgi:hypothetical protein
MAQFEKGVSGNPNGRPKGVVDKRTRLSGLLESHAEALVQKAVDLALKGDSQALRLCIERLIPRPKDETVSIPMEGPFPTNTEGLLQFSQKIMEIMTNGTTTPQEALTLMAIVENIRKLIETSDLSQRLEAIETILKGRKPNETRKIL